MPQVPVGLRKERAARLRAAGAAGLDRFCAGLVGRRVEALVEDGTSARTEHYVPVELDRAYPMGRIVPALVTGQALGRLAARALA
jgi:threonylcarbamoyladenosine tRNA methylthiotransferase MtaB